MRIAASILSIALIAISPSCTPSRVGMSYTATYDSGFDSYYVDIGEYYRYPEREVVVIRDRRIPDDELPVVFFIARRANVSPSEVCDMRLQGASWMDISLHFGLDPEIYYMPVSEVYGDPYAHVYAYYRNTPRREWGSIRLADRDIVNAVNLRFVSEEQGFDPPQVMKMRSEGKSFKKINREARAEHGRGNGRGGKHRGH